MRRVLVGGEEIQFQDLKDGQTFEVIPDPECQFETLEDPTRFRATSAPFKHEDNWTIRCERLH